MPISYADTETSGKNQKIVVNLSLFELRLYEGERIVFESIATGGASWCDDIQRTCKTPPGTYRIIKKHGVNYRSKTYPVVCRKKERCGASMPYYLEFSGEKFGIHGGFVSREPLAHRSHSCIRIPLKKALELHNRVDPGAPVVVLPY
jgi:lipoprotein-anchoring transpeptidase ErfK/SrfK